MMVGNLTSIGENAMGGISRYLGSKETLIE